MSSPTAYLDPLNQALADKLATQPSTSTLTAEQYRALVEQLQKHKPDNRVARTSFTVPFEDGVKTFIFRSKGAEGTLPAIFYFHGAGWIVGR
jgi:acetyl esterase